MDALQKIVERKRAVVADYDLTVQYEMLCFRGAQGGGNLREVAAQGLAGFGHQLYICFVAKSETAEAVPLGFVLPFRALGYCEGRLRFHGWIIKPDRKAHRNFSS